jgi:hypothetical protein
VCDKGESNTLNNTTYLILFTFSAKKIKLYFSNP